MLAPSPSAYNWTGATPTGLLFNIKRQRVNIIKVHICPLDKMTNSEWRLHEWTTEIRVSTSYCTGSTLHSWNLHQWLQDFPFSFSSHITTLPITLPSTHSHKHLRSHNTSQLLTQTWARITFSRSGWRPRVTTKCSSWLWPGTGGTSRFFAAIRYLLAPRAPKFFPCCTPHGGVYNSVIGQLVSPANHSWETLTIQLDQSIRKRRGPPSPSTLCPYSNTNTCVSLLINLAHNSTSITSLSLITFSFSR